MPRGGGDTGHNNLLDDGLSLSDDELQELNNAAQQGPKIEADRPPRVEATPGGFYTLWTYLVYAPTESQFNRAWAQLQGQFRAKRRLLSYVSTTYVSIKKEWSHPFISTYFNYGCRTTSPGESANHSLKSYMVNGFSSLQKTSQAVVAMLEDNKVAFKQAQGEQKIKVQGRYLGKRWLGECPLKITWLALEILTNNHTRMLASFPRANLEVFPLRPEHSTSRLQFGLPSALELRERYVEARLSQDRVLVAPEDCHRRWWLESSLDKDDPILRFQDPYVVENPRGRPVGTGPFSQSSTPHGPVTTELAQRQAAPPASLSASAPPPGPWHGGHRAPSLRRNPSQWELPERLHVGTAPPPFSMAKLIKPATGTPRGRPQARAEGTRARGARARGGARGGTPGGGVVLVAAETAARKPLLQREMAWWTARRWVAWPWKEQCRQGRRPSSTSISIRLIYFELQ